MPITTTGAGVVGEFTPASLPSFVVALLPALSRSQGKLWQDAGKTVAATADGHPVRVAVCPYTAVEFTSPSDAARPLLRNEGGDRWSLDFDGVDDELRTAASVGLSSTTLTLHARWTFSNATDSRIYWFKGLSSGSFSTDYEIRHFGGFQGKRDGGTPGVDIPNMTAVGTYTYSVAMNGAAVDGYRDGAFSGSTTFPGTASGSAQPFAIGRRGDGFGPIAGRLVGNLAYAVTQSAPTVSTVAAYLGTL